MPLARLIRFLILVSESFSGRTSKSGARHGAWNGFSHEWIRKDFLQSGSLGRIKHQYFGNKVSGIVRNSDMLREGIRTSFNLLVSGLHLGSLKGWFSDELCVTE